MHPAFSLLLLLLHSVSAHFAVDVPKSRPFDEPLQPVAPCGGQPLGPRTRFPIVGGLIKGALYHPSGLGNFSVVVSDAPQPADFGKTYFSEGTNVRFTAGLWSTRPVDLSAVPGCVDGANVTFQVVMSTVDGILYSCMDVVLDKSLNTEIKAEATKVASAAATSTVSKTSSSVKSVGFGIMVIFLFGVMM
ncbi:hypothetical protein HDU79_010644 [Rhizoclosmatium sp. JEL0117]|nr:hypothetical protein HDU79_010644 [Rhizoclosmatium sp. JEL0117]